MLHQPSGIEGRYATVAHSGYAPVSAFLTMNYLVLYAKAFFMSSREIFVRFSATNFPDVTSWSGLFEAKNGARKAPSMAIFSPR